MGLPSDAERAATGVAAAVIGVATAEIGMLLPRAVVRTEIGVVVCWGCWEEGRVDLSSTAEMGMLEPCCVVVGCIMLFCSCWMLSIVDFLMSSKKELLDDMTDALRCSCCCCSTIGCGEGVVATGG